MNAFCLKIIACITMSIDHLGYVIFDGPSFFNYIGRLAFPIFAFQISEGYIHTHNIKKYILRLIIFALISQIPFALFTLTFSSNYAINVLFTLLFGLLSILIYDKSNKYLGCFSTIILGICAELLNFDYGFYGVLIVFLFYIFRNNKLQLSLAFIISTILQYAYYSLRYISYGLNVIKYATNFYAPYLICTCLSIIFILKYNKKKGPNIKYTLYLFYPLHLLLLYLISFIV